MAPAPPGPTWPSWWWAKHLTRSSWAIPGTSAWAQCRVLTTIQNVQAAGVPVIVVLISGRPLMVEPQLPGWDAFVAAWLPGTEGQGVADILFGDAYPDSALSYSWPRTTAQVPINVGDATYDPLYEYGYGLSLNPELRLAREAGNVIYSWPEAHTGFAVEEANGLTGNPPGILCPDRPSLSEGRGC